MTQLLYIDPGSGSIIVQALIGISAGAAYFIKVNWYRIKSWLGKKKDDPKDDTASDSSL